MEAFELLFPIALILCVTKVFGLFSNKIGMPAVIGMLIAGLLLGILKYIPSNTVFNMFFGEQTTAWLSVSSRIGVVLIMFSTGLSTNISQLRSAGKASVVITVFGVVCPLILGTVVSLVFMPNESVLSHLFYGAIITATSVSVTVEALKELGKLQTKVGASIVAAAVIDDVIGIVILSVLTGFTSVTTQQGLINFMPTWWDNAPWWLVIIKIVLFFVLAIGIGLLLRKAFRKIEKKYPHNRRIPILAICVCFLYAYVAEKIFGVADITGAYVAGIALGGRLEETPYVETKTDMLGYMFFSPIFFATIGMNLTFTGFNSSFVMFGICYIFVAIIGKLGGCYVASRLNNYTKTESLCVGTGMIVRAEVVLICTEKGISSGLVSNEIYPFIFILIIFSSIVAPLLLKTLYKSEDSKLLNSKT